MFTWSSRLDLCFLLKPKMGGNMKTILSRRYFPPLPIVIDYNCQRDDVKSKDMGRMLAALKRPDRIREIRLSGTAAILDKFFDANKCSFPALETLELGCVHCNHYIGLTIPTTFLEGPCPSLNLRTLILHRISLPSISGSLSSTPGLTYLSLVFDINLNVFPLLVVSHLLSYLQGMPCLRHLELEMKRPINHLTQPTEHNDIFILSKLTSFHFRGHSSFLDTLIAGFTTPSLREVNIDLSDGDRVFSHGNLLPSGIPHFPQLIDGIGEHYHAVQVVFGVRHLQFLLLTHSEYVGHHSPHFKLRLLTSENSVIQMSSALSAKLTTTKELFVVFLHDPELEEKRVISWPGFLLHFSSVRALRTCGTHNRDIASALYQDGGLNLAVLPALEEIELCMDSSSTPEEHAVLEEPALFKSFVSARQKAGLQVKVVSSDRALRDEVWR